MKNLILILLCLMFKASAQNLSTKHSSVKAPPVKASSVSKTPDAKGETAGVYRAAPNYEEDEDADIKPMHQDAGNCFKEAEDKPGCEYANHIKYEEDASKVVPDNTDPHFTPSPSNQKPVF